VISEPATRSKFFNTLAATRSDRLQDGSGFDRVLRCETNSIWLFFEWFDGR